MARSDALTEASLAAELRAFARRGGIAAEIVVAPNRELIARRILGGDSPAIKNGPRVLVDPYMDEDSWELR